MFWVEKGMEEAKTQVLKTCHCLAFKNKKSAHFAGKVLEKLLAKCLKCTMLVSREAISREEVMRESRNSLWKILEEMKISFLIFVARLRDV